MVMTAMAVRDEKVMSDKEGEQVEGEKKEVFQVERGPRLLTWTADYYQ